MNYITVTQAAEKWGISERRVRDYCANGRVFGTRIKGNKWIIPEITGQPERDNSEKKSDPITDTLSEAVRTGITKFTPAETGSFSFRPHSLREPLKNFLKSTTIWCRELSVPTNHTLRISRD